MSIRIVVTPQIERFVACPPAEVEAGDLRGALDALFERTPRLRSYLLDDRGALRRHVRVFVDGTTENDLARRLDDGAEIYIMQSLTGG